MVKLLQQLKTPKKDFFQALKIINHREKHIERSKTVITKLASNTVRTTAVAQFMKTVAGSLTSRIGDTNLGAKVKVDTKSMQFKNGVRSTNIKYGEATMKLEISANGEVKMTDLLDNSNVLQKKGVDGVSNLEDLGISLVGFKQYIDESKKFVSTPENIANLLTQSTEQDGSPFQNFQKKHQKNFLRTSTTHGTAKSPKIKILPKQ